MNIAEKIRGNKSSPVDLKSRLRHLQSRAHVGSISKPRGLTPKKVDWNSIKAAKSRFTSRGSRRSHDAQPRKLIGAGVIGGSLVYFFDPRQGARRRHIAVDKLNSMVRRGSDQARKKIVHAENKLAGAKAEAMSSQAPVEPGALNDQELAHKVESELFRDPSIPKKQINLNAEHGVVYLRGTIESPEQSDLLASRAAEIEGVVGVKNLLHVGTTTT